MWHSNYSKRFLMAALVSALLAGVQLKAATRNDPHRPACVDAKCQKIMSFLKTHYCAESPSGDGAEAGCQIKAPTGPRSGVDVVADFECEWSDAKRAIECKQQGEPPSSVRSLLIKDLQRLGLPAKASGQTYFTIWKSTASGWSLAAAYYSRTAGSHLELCQVIAIIDQSSHVSVLRRLPFQKTNIDKPAVTQWSPIDFADVDGDGRADIVLQGDAYEDHWLEVISVGQGPPRTVFSGLGYFL